MNSKLIGPDSEHYAKLAVDAMRLVRVKVDNEIDRYPVKNVNILKSHGQSSTQSLLFEGFVLQTMRASQQMVTRVQNARIAFVDFNLNKFRLALGIQVLISDPKNLEKIR